MYVGSKDLNVVEHIVNEATGEREPARAFNHKLFLSGWASDTPARAKAMNAVGHSGRLGCPNCLLNGSNVNARGNCGMHMLGYRQDVRCGMLVDGAPVVHALCGAANTKLTHQQHVDRDMLAELHPELATRVGSHGLSPVIKYIPYADYNQVFLASVAHALLRGVVKDFIGLIFHKNKAGSETPWYSIPRKARGIMAARGGHIIATMDQFRPYRCVVMDRGNWVMEDYMNFVEIWSVYVMAGRGEVSCVPPWCLLADCEALVKAEQFYRVLQGETSLFHHKVLEDMWGMLRRAVVFYLRPYVEDPAGSVHDNRSLYKSECEKHHSLLFEYAKLAELHFGNLLCKPNLHAMLCSLPGQQRSRGHAFFSTEYWLEMLVQQAKQWTKFRTTGCPEKLIVGQMLMKLTLDRILLESPNTLSMGEWLDQKCPAHRYDTFIGVGLDPGAEDGTGMLGSGYAPHVGGQQEGECVAAVVQHFRDFPVGMWDADEVSPKGMLVYKRAQKTKLEVFHSLAYERSVTRMSHYIRVQYNEVVNDTSHGPGKRRKTSNTPNVNRRDVVFVGVVRYFLMAQAVIAEEVDSTRVLRFAICDLYAAAVDSTPIGELLQVRGMCGGPCVCACVSRGCVCGGRRPMHHAFPVLLDDIDGKVVRCGRGKLESLPSGTVLSFIPYSHSPSGFV